MIFQDDAQTVCGSEIPLAKWVFVYCAFSMFEAVLRIPCLYAGGNVNDYDRFTKTRKYSLFIFVCTFTVNIGLLIWGSTFFWDNMNPLCVRT